MPRQYGGTEKNSGPFLGHIFFGRATTVGVGAGPTNCVPMAGRRLAGETSARCLHVYIG